MTIDLPPPFDAGWFRFALGFVIGAALGSFGTMLAYRLPRGISIVAPRSHCPRCKTVLRVRDLIPLFSWLRTSGKCRYCQAEIGVRYLWIEVGCSFLGGVIGVAVGCL